MEVLNSTQADIEEIFRLYKLATDLQKQKFTVHWPEFERSMVEQEIMELMQWKLVVEGKVACVWATTFSDPKIWGIQNEDPSVYIHRIATNPDFRGKSLVSEIVKWAIKYAQIKRKQFVRMDTVGYNTGLINYYTNCGFEFLGLSKLVDSTGLPAHYENAEVSLFQLKV